MCMNIYICKYIHDNEHQIAFCKKKVSIKNKSPLQKQVSTAKNMFSAVFSPSKTSLHCKKQKEDVFCSGDLFLMETSCKEIVSK